MKCGQCGEVKRCAMHRDVHTGELIYLCRPCARELGYRVPNNVHIPQEN
jgi:hypothetical protein